jgi:DNA-binding IclR family transcriptional regulator
LKTVVKAVEILELMMESPDGATLTDLSSAMGEKLSTIHHLVSTLRQAGMLQQDPSSKVYRLGLKAFRIGQAALDHLDLAKRAQPLMRELARVTGEGVTLVQYEGEKPVYVLGYESSHTIGMRYRPGSPIPLHCTGSGKIFLSRMSDEELSACLEALPLKRYTPNTVVDADRLREEIAKVGLQGYALDNQEVEEGLLCIAAPILNHQGEVVGSISLSGPNNRLEDRLDKVIKQVCKTARSVSLHG